MKRLSQILKRAVLLTAMLAVGIMAYADTTYYLLWGTNDDYTQFSSKGSVTASGSWTWTVGNLSSGQNYFFGVSTNNTPSSPAFISGSSASDKDIVDGGSFLSGKGPQNRNGKYYYRISLSSAQSSVTVNYNSSTGKYTIATAVASYTISTSGSNCTFYPERRSITAAGSGTFNVTPAAGYKLVSARLIEGGTGTIDRTDLGGATTETTITVTRPTATGTLTITTEVLTFNISATAGEYGTVSPDSQSSIAYNGSTSFTASPAEGYVINQASTTFSGTANVSYSGNTITLTNITEGGTLNVVFASNTDKTPVVNFGMLPVQGSPTDANDVMVSSYLINRFCETVTEVGFQWNTGNSFTSSTNNYPYSAHTGQYILPRTVASLASLQNGDSIKCTIPKSVFSSITAGTNLFFRAYVTTAKGTGYSDVVGIFYTPCLGLTSVELSPASAGLAAGYSVELSVVARGAGKSPVYTWYLDQADDKITAGTATAIEGATGSTYTYTMPNPAGSHSIKVKVSEAECGTSQWTHETAVSTGITATKKADITACTEPSFILAAGAEAITTTPWAATAIAVTSATGIDKYTWEVSPSNGVLTGTSDSGATFRADIISGDSTEYTVTFTAFANCSNAEVKVQKSVKVIVENDVEKCD